MRKRRLRGALLIALAGALAGGGVAVAAGSFSTVVQTIQDRDRDNVLEPAPGEDYLVRRELGQALPGRERRRKELTFFAQMTDFQMNDEESPARVEFLDKLDRPFTTAYRPQEGTTTQVVNEMVRELRNSRSRVTHEGLDLVMTTGDNTDNTQCNETRWVIDLLDGAASGEKRASVPGGGVAQNCAPAQLLPGGRQVDPNSGIEGSCGLRPDGELYDGVRDDNEYYEPDSSDEQEAGANNEDGPGYSPNEQENLREAGRSSEVRDFPGLFERMNQPFLAVGFDELPWYSIFGNHDGLVQGTAGRNPFFDGVAQGCVKVTGLTARTEARARARLAAGDRATALRIARAEVSAIRSRADELRGIAEIVPRDPRRALLRKSEYIAQHFVTSGTPVGHGFRAENIATGEGNYAFDPQPGAPLRFVVLDSVAEMGIDRGNINGSQFRWLHEQLRAAETDRKLVMVFAHHSLRTMDQPFPGPFPGDQGGRQEPVHFGEKHPVEPEPRPCAIRDPGTEPIPNETLRCLLLRHPSVTAFIAGHEHNNFIQAHERVEGNGPLTGGFWEIVTASHIDWPQQSRVLDLVDNLDGNLSIFATMIDHGAPPNPGGAPPSDGRGRAGESVRRIPSMSRELAYNDPDARNGEDGRPDARGTRLDRNVELLVRDPYVP